MKFIVDFLRLIRFPNLVIILLTQYAVRFGIIYPFLRQAGLDFFLSEKLFAFLALSTVSIAAAGYIINDYFDVKLDYVNKPNQTLIGKNISRRQAMFLHIITNAFGLLLAIYIAFKIGHPLLVLFQLISAILLWFYSVSLKKQVLVGNLSIAALTALVPFTAGYYEVAVMFDEVREVGSYASESLAARSLGSLLFSIQYLIYWIFGYSIFAFLLSMIREIIKDCEDIKGDEAFNCKTLPIVFGIPSAKKVAIGIAILTFAFILLVEWIQFISKDWPSLLYFILLVSLPLLWVVWKISKASEKKHFFIISQAIKIIMLFGILYIIVIYSYS